MVPTGSAGEANPASSVYTDLFERLLATFTAVEHVEINADGTIAAVNAAFSRHLGVPATDLVGRRVADFLVAADARTALGWAAGDDLPREPRLVNFVTASNETYTIRCIVGRHEDRLVLIGEAADAASDGITQELMRVNNEFATLSRELARKGRELERAHGQLSTTLQDLETSYWHLRKIQEVMPVCMGCGQVKTDGSRWESVVDYLRSNEIFLSHGYCPPCADRVAREFGLEDD